MVNVQGVSRGGALSATVVAFEPVWHSNPYHAELTRGLGKEGVEVVDAGSLKSLVRKWKTGQIVLQVLHLHLLPYFKWSPVGLIRYALFFLRLDILKRGGVRLVWTVHDLRNHDSRNTGIEGFMARFVARRSDAFIVHGESARKMVEDSLGVSLRDRIWVVPHGNYLGSYPNKVSRKDARENLGLEGSGPTFLFLGLIRPYKGVVKMIESFRRTGGGQSKLVIAGEPIDLKMKESVEEAIQGDDRILFFPGFVDDARVQEYMNACDVVVLPYQQTLTSGVAVLAMSFGKACVAPDSGCVTDALDDRGAVFFDPVASDALDRAFSEMESRQGEFVEMGQHNLEKASEWSWEWVAGKTAAIYKNCLQGGGLPDRPLEAKTSSE